MAKKKTNGFHMFANSRKAVYEARLGKRISAKKLIELSTQDWKELSVEEQTAWLSKPKTNDKNMNRATGSANKITHFVQNEIFKRTYKTGLDRLTAKEEFFGNILWREKDNLETLLTRKWAMIVLSADGSDIANKIVCMIMDKGKIVDSMSIWRKDAFEKGEPRSDKDFEWDVGLPQDVNEACNKMNRFIYGGCSGYILVPAHQRPELAAILNLMKEERDKLLGRDTQSIRLDRLICLEDAVPMLRKLNNMKPNIDEIDEKWTIVQADWQSLTTVEFARAACDYFLTSQSSPSQNSLNSNDPVPQPLFVLPEVGDTRPRQKMDRGEKWTRPNPFFSKPQTVFASGEVMAAVTKWLETVSLENDVPLDPLEPEESNH